MPRKKKNETDMSRRELHKNRRKSKRVVNDVRHQLELIRSIVSANAFNPPDTEDLIEGRAQVVDNSDLIADCFNELKQILDREDREGEEASDEYSSGEEDDNDNALEGSSSVRKRKRDETSDGFNVSALLDDENEVNNVGNVVTTPMTGAQRDQELMPPPKFRFRPIRAAHPSQGQQVDINQPSSSRNLAISVPICHVSSTSNQSAESNENDADSDETFFEEEVDIESVRSPIPETELIDTPEEEETVADVARRVNEEFIENPNHYHSKILMNVCQSDEEEEIESVNWRNKEFYRSCDDDHAFSEDADQDEEEDDTLQVFYRRDEEPETEDEEEDDEVIVPAANTDGEAVPMKYASFVEYFQRESEMEHQEERHRSFVELFTAVMRKCFANKTTEKIVFNLFRAREKVYRQVKMRGLDSSKKRWITKHPRVLMDYEIKDKKTGRIFMDRNNVRWPRKKYPAHKYQKISEFTHCTINDLFEHSQTIHGRLGIEPPSKGFDMVDIFMDGLPVAKSSENKLDVSCLRFPYCKNIYVYGMHLYGKDAKLNCVQVLAKLIQDLERAGFYVRRIIADGPQRAALKCLHTFAGYYSCEFCLTKGEKPENKLIFPGTTMNDVNKKRSAEWWRDMAERIKNEGIRNIPDEELCGLTGTSPLLDLPYFNMYRAFTCEPMHMIGGVCKKFVQMIFKINKKQGKRLTAEQTSLMTKFDQRWMNIRMPREFCRLNRSMIRSHVFYKSQEYFSMIAIGFLAIADVLTTDDITTRNKRMAWLLFAYLTRCAMFDNKMWKVITQKKVPFHMLMSNLYTCYEIGFEVNECTWNLHNFSHLQDLRDIAPLPDLSALQFEGFFSILKKVVKPNTCSFSKQVIEILTAYNVRQHNCNNVVRFSEKDSDRYSDNKLFTREGDFYEIDKIEDDHYLCRKYLTSKFTTSPQDRVKLNWDVVGVKRIVSLTSTIHVVPKSWVIGKATIDQDVIISVPFDFFFV